MALNEDLIQTKNLLSSSGAWINLAHVDVNDDGGDLRIACNVSNYVIWNGWKWTPLPVELGVIREEREETPQLEIRISNITKIPESFAEQYDGLITSVVTIYEINTEKLSVVNNIPQLNFEITGSSFGSIWAHFTLGMYPNPMQVKDPKEKIFKNFCEYGYPNSKDPRCPYTGVTYTTCPRTLAACITRNGATAASRYGGFPAIGTNKIYVN